MRVSELDNYEYRIRPPCNVSMDVEHFNLFALNPAYWSQHAQSVSAFLPGLQEWRIEIQGTRAIVNRTANPSIRSCSPASSSTAKSSLRNSTLTSRKYRWRGNDWILHTTPVISIDRAKSPANLYRHLLQSFKLNLKRYVIFQTLTYYFVTKKMKNTSILALL